MAEAHQQSCLDPSERFFKDCPFHFQNDRGRHDEYDGDFPIVCL
jgi:hypothetical protein